MYEQIAANKRKTVLLIFGAIVLLGAVGYALGLWAGSGVYGLVGAVALALVLSLGSFFGGDRLVLAMSDPEPRWGFDQVWPLSADFMSMPPQVLGLGPTL